MIAAKNGNLECVKLLISYGADITHYAPQRHWWREYKHPQVAAYIQQCVQDLKDLNITRAQLERSKPKTSPTWLDLYSYSDPTYYNIIICVVTIRFGCKTIVCTNLSNSLLAGYYMWYGSNGYCSLVWLTIVEGGQGGNTVEPRHNVDTSIGLECYLHRLAYNQNPWNADTLLYILYLAWPQQYHHPYKLTLK